MLPLVLMSLALGATSFLTGILPLSFVFSSVFSVSRAILVSHRDRQKIIWIDSQL